MTTTDVLILLVLALIPLELTVAMFLSRQMMLGFPSAIFWAVLGGYAYTQSSTPWGDWQYFLFFGSFGMVIFSVIAMYGLRERRDETTDVQEDEGYGLDKGFYDEEHDADGRRIRRSSSNGRTRTRRGVGGWASGLEPRSKQTPTPEPEEGERSRAVRERSERRMSGRIVKRTKDWGEFK